MRSKIFTAAAALAILGALGAAADAAPRQRVVRAEPPALTIYKRSYLEPSNQVPTGSYHNYVVESTVLGAEFAARDIFRDRIGESNLPDRFYAPGWTGPQFVFDSGYRVGRGY